MRSRATGLLQQQPKPSAAGADYEAMSSPVKQVPLAPASDDDPRPSHPTTRAFFCGVVVEGAGEGELAQGTYSSGGFGCALYLTLCRCSRACRISRRAYARTGNALSSSISD
jgi:hypothetical protein